MDCPTLHSFPDLLSDLFKKEWFSELKINLVNKVQSDLLETRAVVSLVSILFRQVERQLVPGIFALEVKRGEMAHRKRRLVWGHHCAALPRCLRSFLFLSSSSCRGEKGEPV